MTQNVKIQLSVLAVVFASVFIGLVAGAFAGAPLGGDGIRALMADKTVEGKMNDGSAYSEFYQADGKIKAKDYSGRWTIEGDTMCFVYSTAPAKMCYQIGQNANGIDWMQNSKVLGTGTLTQGNVRSY